MSCRSPLHVFVCAVHILCASICHNHKKLNAQSLWWDARWALAFFVYEFELKGSLLMCFVNYAYNCIIILRNSFWNCQMWCAVKDNHSHRLFTAFHTLCGCIISFIQGSYVLLLSSIKNSDFGFAIILCFGGVKLSIQSYSSGWITHLVTKTTETFSRCLEQYSFFLLL